MYVVNIGYSIEICRFLTANSDKSTGIFTIFNYLFFTNP